MRGKTYGRLDGRRSGIPLSVRGGPLRTFGSLVAFCIAVLLGCGGYLIAEQIAHPVEAQAAALLFAALLIATAVTLIYPLLHTTAKLRARATPKRRAGETVSEQGLLTEARSGAWNAKEDSAFPNRYVDHARLRAVKKSSSAGYGREISLFQDKTVM